MSAMSLSTPIRVGADGFYAGGRLEAGGTASVTLLLEREFIEPKINGMTRSQLVDRIMTHNASATAEFLERFDVESLWSYLDHLLDTQRPRVAATARVRPTRRAGVSVSVRQF